MFLSRRATLSCLLFSLAIGYCDLRRACAQDQSLSAEERQQLVERAKQLNNQVVVLFGKGSYREAKPLAEEEVKIRLQALGENHADTAGALNNLGSLLHAMGDHAAARPYLEQALAIRKRVLGENHPDTAASLNNLGGLLNTMEDYAAARPYLEQALAIRKSVLGENHPDTAASLNDLGGLFSSMGDERAARTYYEQALAIRRKALGDNHADTANSLNLLGDLLRTNGDFAAARPYLEQALAVREKILGENHPDTATSLNSLGTLLQSIGDHEKARACYERALAIRKTVLGESDPRTMIPLNNIAALLRSTGEFSTSRKYFEQALATTRQTFGENHFKTALALNNLGSFFEIVGDYATARTYFQQALAINKKMLGENHPSTALVLGNLGLVLRELGDYAVARPDCEQALAIYQKVYGENHPLTVPWLTNVGDLDARVGDWQAASQRYESARRIARRHVARVLSGLSEREQLIFVTETDQGEFHKCLSLGYWQLEDPDIASRSAGWLLNGKGMAQESLAERARMARDNKDPKLADTAKELRSVRTRLAKFSLSLPSSKDKEAYQQQLAQLNQEEQDLSRQLASAAGETYRDDPWVTLAEVRKALAADSVLVDIARFGVYDFATQGPRKWQPAHYVAWIIRPLGQGRVHLVDLGPADAIDLQIQSLRKKLESVQGKESALTKEGEPQATAEFREAFQAVSEQIWRPLAPYVGHTKRLILSPDGALWLVPWAAIPVQPLETGKFLVERMAINYVISGRDVVKAAGKTVLETRKPVLFADPNFDLSPEEVATASKAVLRAAYQEDQGQRATSEKSFLPRVGRLPGTATEAEAVKPNVEKVTGQPAILYRDMYALESVAKALNRPKFAIFSTHGYFLPDQLARPDDKDAQLALAGQNTRGVPLTKEGKPFENPLLRCGLLFAGCNPRNEGQAGSGDDGVLTGMEIVGIDFRGTELVVLSACETGLGTVNNGEGVAGLRQAFQLAGAEAVVATLWQIPDADSARLMNDFFANLAAGQSKGEALRNAQLKRIESRRSKFGAAHPFFWAAYTLTGG